MTKLEVERVVLSQSDETGAKVECANKLDCINSRKRVALIFAGAILVFAVLKFYFYFGTLRDILGDEMQYTQVGAALLVYLVAAYIHVSHTGYALAWLWASFLYKRDTNTFKRSGEGRSVAQHREE